MKTKTRFALTLLALLLAAAFCLSLAGCGTETDPASADTEAGETSEPVARTGERVKITYSSGVEKAAGSKVKDQKAYPGETVELAANKYINYGHVFRGWTDGTNTYEAGEAVTVPAEGMTLTAVWEEGGTRFLIDSCDTNTGWWGMADINNGMDDVREGVGYNYSSGKDLIVFCHVFDNPIDLSPFVKTGVIHVWVWVDDIENVRTNAPELGLLELYDSNQYAYSFAVANSGLTTGWNEVVIPFPRATSVEGDLSDVVSFRLFQYVSADATIRMDGLEAWMPETACTVHFDGNGAGYVLGLSDTMDMENIPEGSELEMPENLFARHGYTFAGWSDGNAVYAAGEECHIPEGGLTLKAQWEPTERFALTFDGKEADDRFTLDVFDGQRLRLPARTQDGWVVADENDDTSFLEGPAAPGMAFVGWSDGTRTLAGGAIYTVSADVTALTAVWRALDDPALLSDAVGAWELTEGGYFAVPSAIGGVSLESHDAVWLNTDTFGRAADFSTEGSYLVGKSTGIELTDSFTLSAFIMAPVREEGDRVILSMGGWKLYLDGKTGQLAFSGNGLEGCEPAGGSLIDGRWHHVMVTLDDGTLTYYTDGAVIASETVTGTLKSSSDTLYVGGTVKKNWFDGTVAQVRIYDTAKTPAEVTATVIDPSDNEPKALTLDMKRGSLIERPGFRKVGRIGFEVWQPDMEYETVDITHVQACKKFGFDYVKITPTPNHLIDANGHLILENMTYVTTDVDLILAEGMPVLFCLHPEPDYKPTYLGDLDNFELMCNWYREFAAYIGDHWSPDEVAIQLMTEPGNNVTSVSWTWMSDRMWGAVRNELPDHTLVTSSDTAGNLEALKTMSPASDQNLAYSFTTYEPYTVGFGTASSGMSGTVSFWNYLKGVPYPVPDGLTDEEINAMVEEITENVPEEYHNGAVNTVRAYLRGSFDSNPFYKNHYDTGYTEGWNLRRMDSLGEWRNKYGGNIHIMCVEFGCMDPVTAVNMFGAEPGSGISAETRINLIRELRQGFENNDIGWSYWLFNGVFTLFDPEKRVADVPTDDEFIARAYDAALIEDALGLTPDYSWVK